MLLLLLPRAPQASPRNRCLVSTAGENLPSPRSDRLPSSPGERRRQRLAAEGRHRRVSWLLGQQGDLAPTEHAELTWLLRRGDTYDASSYSASHAAFKAEQNAVFASLASSLGGAASPVVYLDGPDGGSTSALRAAGFATDQLHVANPHASTCAALSAPPHSLEHVAHASAEEALASEQWRSRAFCAAYFDGCGGQAEPLIAMIRALFHERRAAAAALAPAVAVGFTLTRAEPGGASLGDREVAVLRALTAAAGAVGYSNPSHVADDPGRWGLRPMGKEHEGTTTVWTVVARRPEAQAG